MQRNSGAEQNRNYMSRSLKIFVFLVVLAGIVLRLAYPFDIEWKGDEIWTFQTAMQIAAHGRYPEIGMPTSMGSDNPGLSVWVFGWLAAMFKVVEPPDLARAVQITNSAALIGLLLFVWRQVPADRKAVWYWAAALWAANPMAIIFERKIWPPSVLLLPMICLIALWWNRRHPIAAFLWGGLGAAMSQVHLGFMFLAFALLVWTVIQDRSSFAFRYWFAGSAFASIAAVPWLFALLSAGSSATLEMRFPLIHFYIRWLLQPFGLGAEYSIGSQNLVQFLAYPMVMGMPTWFVAAAHVVMVGLLVVVVAVFFKHMMAGRMSARKLFVGDSNEAVLVAATFWGYGGVLTAITIFGVDSHRHYLIAVAPVMALWCARMIFLDPEILRRSFANWVCVVLCVAQLVTSASLLAYIHDVQTFDAEYGATWNSQQN